MINSYPRYILVFTPATGVWRRFLKRGFGHVYLIMRDDPNWIKIDPLWSRLDIQIMPMVSVDTPERAGDDPAKFAHTLGFTTLSVDRIKRKKRRWHLARLVPCTGTLQYILGTSYVAFTPYQLYKKLSKEQKWADQKRPTKKNK